MKKPRGILFDYGDTLFEQLSWNPEIGHRRLMELAIPPHSVSFERADSLRIELTEIYAARDGSYFEFPLIKFQRLLFERLVDRNCRRINRLHCLSLLLRIGQLLLSPILRLFRDMQRRLRSRQFLFFLISS